MNADNKKKLIGKPFTSENQPSPEAKSKGMKKSWEYRKARKQFFEKMCEMKLADGSVRDFWGDVRDKLQQMIFDKKSKLKPVEQAELIMRLVKELMPEDKSVTIDSKIPIQINISKNDNEL